MVGTKREKELLKEQGFISIRRYKKEIHLFDILKETNYSNHLNDRMNRFKKGIEINKNADIEIAFVVDKKGKGKTINAVTKNGIIFILNFNTLEIITVLIAKPYQVIRLYKAIGEKYTNSLYKACKEHEKNGYNLLY